MIHLIDGLPLDREGLLVGCCLASLLLMVLILATATQELYKLIGEVETRRDEDSQVADVLTEVVHDTRRELDDLARQEPAFFDELAEVDWPTLHAMVKTWKGVGRRIENYGTGNEFDPRISEARAASGESVTVAQTHGVVAEPPRPGIRVSEVQALWDSAKEVLLGEATERHGYHSEEIIPFDVARAEDDGMGWQRPGVE